MIKALAIGSAVTGVGAVKVLKLSRYWLIGSFVPLALITYMDAKYTPYTEVENLYKFIYERRKANNMYKKNHTAVTKELESLDKLMFTRVQDELIKSNKTIYEASNELNNSYLNSAKL